MIIIFYQLRAGWCLVRIKFLLCGGIMGWADPGPTYRLLHNSIHIYLLPHSSLAIFFVVSQNFMVNFVAKFVVEATKC